MKNLGYVFLLCLFLVGACKPEPKEQTPPAQLIIGKWEVENVKFDNKDINPLLSVAAKTVLQTAVYEFKPDSSFKILSKLELPDNNGKWSINVDSMNMELTYGKKNKVELMRIEELTNTNLTIKGDVGKWANITLTFKKKKEAS